MSKHSIKDEQLVSSYIAGCNDALSILIQRHRIKVLSFIVSKVRDKSLAEDLVQDTFIKVIKTLKKGNYNEQGKFLPWVMRIAYNLCIDYFRKNKKFKLLRSNDNFNIFDIIKDKSDSMEDQIVQKKIIDDLKLIINDRLIYYHELIQDYIDVFCDKGFFTSFFYN